MKKIILLLLCTLAISGVQASDETSYTQRYKDIEYHDFDFQVEINDTNTADVRWNGFPQNRGFTSYQLMYSTLFANPSYPEQTPIYSSDVINITGTKINLTQGEKHYFRICSITYEGYGVTGRYCSSPKKIERIVSLQEPHTELSPEIMYKVDKVIDEFVQSLEQLGYTDIQVNQTVDALVLQLDEYVEIPKYKEVAVYMQKSLKDYDERKEMYEDLERLFYEILEEE